MLFWAVSHGAQRLAVPERGPLSFLLACNKPINARVNVAGEDLEPQPSLLPVGMQNGTATLEDSGRFLTKLITASP